MERSRIFWIPVVSLVFYVCLAAQTPGTLKWSYATSGEIYSSPTLGPDGVLFIGVNDDSEDGINDNKVIALSPDGTLKWETEVGDWVDAVPAIGSDGVLYVGCWDGFLYAIDCETGEILWRFETFGVIEASVAIGEDGVIYFGNGESAFYAVNPDGTAAWTTQNNGGEANPLPFDDWVDGSPTIDDTGNLWVGDLFGNIAQIAPDRTVLWTFDTGVGIPTSPAVGKDGTVYFGDEAGDVLALTPGSNQPKWIFDTGLEDIGSSPVIGPDGTIYIGTGSDSMYALDGQTGAVKPGWPFTEPTDVVYSTPAIAENGTVYFGSGDRNLYAVDNQGKKRWSFLTEGFVDSSPAIGPDGTVYVGSTDGKVYAIYGDSPLGFSRWPKFRGSNEALGRLEAYRKWIESEGIFEPNPYQDPDGDGVKTVLEWAYGLDPGSADDIAALTPKVIRDEGSILIQSAWKQEAQGVGFYFSDDLLNWEMVSLEQLDSYTWLEEVLSEVVGGNQMVELKIKTEQESPRFFRIQASQQ